MSVASVKTLICLFAVFNILPLIIFKTISYFNVQKPYTISPSAKQISFLCYQCLLPHILWKIWNKLWFSNSDDLPLLWEHINIFLEALQKYFRAEFKMTMELVSEIFLTHHSRKCTLHSIHPALFHSSNHTVFENTSVTLLQTDKNERIVGCAYCIWCMEMCSSAKCLHVPYLSPALRLKLLSLLLNPCIFARCVWFSIQVVFRLADFRYDAAKLCPKLLWQDCMKFLACMQIKSLGRCTERNLQDTDKHNFRGSLKLLDHSTGYSGHDFLSLPETRADFWTGLQH